MFDPFDSAVGTKVYDPYFCYLVQHPDGNVLFDTGVHPDAWRDPVARLGEAADAFELVMAPDDDIVSKLALVGLAPADVGHVVQSHLHFDHAGGNTRLADGKPVPTFPKARYVVQTGEWEDATRPHERNRASYLEENYVPLAERKQLEVVQGAVEVTPGVRVVPVGGHTAYLQMVVVESQGQTLAIPTDLIPTSSHLPLPFIMAYDLFPVGTLEAKRRLLAQVVEEKWWLLFYHDPRMAVGRVGRDQEKYVLSEVLA